MTVELEDRLRALGDALDVEHKQLVDDVFARIDEPVAPIGSVLSLGRVAAVLVTVIAIAVVAVPSSRRTVADWLGFDGVRLERRPATSVPVDPDSLEGRDVGTVVTVDSEQILVSEFVGSLDDPVIGKIATGDNRVTQVAVNGAVGIWIDGAPHEVTFFGVDGEIVFQGLAGNTLLWQDGDVIRRLEGFSEVDAAIEFAGSMGP